MTPRGISNPAGRFAPEIIEWLEAPPPAKLSVREDRARSVLVKNTNPRMPFAWSLNPYRGCTHACAYCYAREYHEYMELGAGTDFERILFTKPDAPALLEAALRRRSWRGERITMSGVTDPYQPIERQHRLTRGCLEVMTRFRNPVGIITRSPLIVRDLDLLVELAEHGAAQVTFSIPVMDPDLARLLEPGAPPPSARLAAIAALSEAGVPVGVSLAPLIPGLNDAGVPEALRAARAAGAAWAWTGLVNLPGSVAAVFEERLRAAAPLRADGVMARLRRGRDKSWEATEQLFAIWHRKLGFSAPPVGPCPSPFRRPDPAGQLTLF